MSPDCLRPVWERLDCEPPLFTVDDVDGGLAGSLDRFVGLGILRETSSARSASCPACGNGHVGAVESLPDHQSSRAQLYLVCPECGPVPIGSDRLKRWVIDTPHLLTLFVRAVNGRSAPAEVVADRLWQLGSANWCGRLRQAYFARAIHTSDRPAVIESLSSRPKAILFLPSEASVQSWHKPTPNPTIALESAIALGPDGSITFDRQVVESRLADACPAAQPKAKRRRKRADRAAKIEMITKELAHHLQSAHNHAHATYELKGCPELLPRPTQKQLAELCGLSEPDVTRCFKDVSARELNLYWRTAGDLQQILKFEGPISRGSIS